jgi:hypothetical protein
MKSQIQATERWLLENRDGIDTKIRRGIAQLDRDEGYPKTDWMHTWRNTKPTLNDAAVRSGGRGIID